MRYCLLALCGVLASPLLFAQGSALIIPRSADDMRQFMSNGDARCPGCGIVSNIRQVAAKGMVGNSDEEAAIARTGDSGPGEDVDTVTHLSIDFQGKSASAAPAATAKRWQVTVRYDDGSYAAFEQDNAPSVRKGDRIQVVDGRVERR